MLGNGCILHIIMGKQVPASVRAEIRQLRESLLDLTGIINRPQPDAAVIAAAGVDLDRALFPLLARIERHGPLGVVELAELAARDYTTVSRQVAKLESLGLVTRRPGLRDRRVREAVITPAGLRMTGALDAAREEIVSLLLADWDKKDVRDLGRLLRRLADVALAWTAGR
jgi:DNA-binding MarR family transcriptional regulator